MNDAELQLIYRSVVVAKLIYASSFWWIFTNASDRQRLEAFLRRGRRHGLYSADTRQTISNPNNIKEADESLFHNVAHHTSLYNFLHSPLPEQSQYCYSLRNDHYCIAIILMRLSSFH